MICRKCGNNVPEYLTVCPVCGAPLNYSARPNQVGPAPVERKSSGNRGLLVTLIVLVSLAIAVGIAFGLYFMLRDNPSSGSTTVQRIETRVVTPPTTQNSSPSPSRTVVSNQPKFRSGVIVDPVDSYVNVRQGPGTGYAIVCRLDVGETVYYVRGGKWVKVYDLNNNYLGYVFHDRIR